MKNMNAPMMRTVGSTEPTSSSSMSSVEASTLKTTSGLPAMSS